MVIKYMSFKDQICPYSKECCKYKNMDCNKLKNYTECGDYIDFIMESSGTFDDFINYLIEGVSMDENTKRKSKKMKGKCPYQLCCYATLCVDEYLEYLGNYDEAYYHESCDIVDYKNCEEFEFNRESEEWNEEFGIIMA